MTLGALLRETLRAAAAAIPPGSSLYAVGGTVRDLLLGCPPQDLDVAVEGGRVAARALVSTLGALPGWNVEALHERFGTATLRSPGGVRLDVAATRTEKYPTPGALPVVSDGATIEEDLARRDFTIHAMARLVLAHRGQGDLIDPFGGAVDLADRRLRLLHAGSFSDDPTRAFRAARYLARLGLADDREETLKALRVSVDCGAWANVSGDRLRRSLQEILEEPSWRIALSWLSHCGVLGLVIGGWSFATAGRTAADPDDVAFRWRLLLSTLDAAGKRRAADRLVFSRRLRRDAGVPT